jgi:hypothetical protein
MDISVWRFRICLEIDMSMFLWKDYQYKRFLQRKWEYPTMIVTMDAKRRVSIPTALAPAAPGDILSRRTSTQASSPISSLSAVLKQDSSDVSEVSSASSSGVVALRRKTVGHLGRGQPVVAIHARDFFDEVGREHRL